VSSESSQKVELESRITILVKDYATKIGDLESELKETKKIIGKRNFDNKDINILSSDVTQLYSYISELEEKIEKLSNNKDESTSNTLKDSVSNLKISKTIFDEVIEEDPDVDALETRKEREVNKNLEAVKNFIGEREKISNMNSNDEIKNAIKNLQNTPPETDNETIKPFIDATLAKERAIRDAIANEDGAGRPEDLTGVTGVTGGKKRRFSRSKRVKKGKSKRRRRMKGGEDSLDDLLSNYTTFLVDKIPDVQKEIKTLEEPVVEEPVEEPVPESVEYSNSSAVTIGQNLVPAGEGATSSPANQVDLYAILGLKTGASDEDIKSAYKSKALESHPDKNLGDPDASKKIQNINNAYKNIQNIYK
jgi:hypothetical protein